MNSNIISRLILIFIVGLSIISCRDSPKPKLSEGELILLQRKELDSFMMQSWELNNIRLYNKPNPLIDHMWLMEDDTALFDIMVYDYIFLEQTLFSVIKDRLSGKYYIIDYPSVRYNSLIEPFDKTNEKELMYRCPNTVVMGENRGLQDFINDRYSRKKLSKEELDKLIAVLMSNKSDRFTQKAELVEYYKMHSTPRRDKDMREDLPFLISELETMPYTYNNVTHYCYIYSKPGVLIHIKVQLDNTNDDTQDKLYHNLIIMTVFQDFY